MQTDTIFDMASVTKAMATTLAIMRLVDQGLICTSDTIGSILPDFATAPVANATVADLLMHRSGLPAWEALYLFIYRDRPAVRNFLSTLPLMSTAYLYSDLGYWVLGFIVEEVSGRCLNDFVIQELYAPLGLTDIMFLPLEQGIPQSRIAATTWGDYFEMAMVDEVNLPGFSFNTTHLQDNLTLKDQGQFGGWRDFTLRGHVNDVNSGHAGGGISGHAGLFSTASDMAVLGQLLLNGGIYNGVRLFSEEVVEQFLRPVPGMGNHGLGFRFNLAWMGFPAARGGFTAFGHDGFTGTQVWFDQELNLQVIVLTNRQNIGHIINAAVGGTQFRPEMTNVLAQAASIAIAPRVANTVVMDHFGDGVVGRGNMRHSEVHVPANVGVMWGPAGTSPTRTIPITNHGTARIVDLEATLVGSNFEIVGPVPTSIWPGSTVNITVRPVTGLLAAGSPFLGTLELTGWEVGPASTASLLFDIPFSYNIDLRFTISAYAPPGGGITQPPPDDENGDDNGDPGHPEEYEFHEAFMQGDAVGNFRPRANITRGEVAAILARTQIEDFEPSTLPDGMKAFDVFSDVTAHWAYYYLAWAYDAGFVRGFDDGTFRPNAPITRQEFAAMVARTVTLLPPGNLNFADAGAIADWAQAYVTTVARAGWMVGDSDGRFNPAASIIRAEVATVVNRILGRIDSQATFAAATVHHLARARQFPDVAATAWYFPSVVAASNDHNLARAASGAINWKYILP